VHRWAVPSFASPGRSRTSQLSRSAEERRRLLDHLTARDGFPRLPGFVALLPDEFVVDDLLGEFALPTMLLTGVSGDLAALPTPLGSFPELFSPPTLAGPFGTPLTP
jgi:hypothetical protein